MRRCLLILLLPLATITYAQDIAYQSVSLERMSFTRAFLSGKVIALKRQRNETPVVDGTTIDLANIEGLSAPPIEYLLKIENQRNESLELLKECKSTFKNDVEASSFFSKMGWNYLEEGNRVEARKRFNWAYFLNEHNDDAFWGLGVMTFQEGRLIESTQFMERGIQVADPKNITLMVDLATVYTHLYTVSENPIHLKRALALIESSLKLNPDYANAYMQRALAELVNGQVVKAWASFHRGYDLSPNEIDQNVLSALLTHQPDPKGIFTK